jgi:hypothetical protein
MVQYRGRAINLMDCSYTLGGRVYYGLFLKNGYDLRSRYFRIRYLRFAPGIARSDTFASNWGPLIIFFILMALVSSIAFIRKDIISGGAIFLLQTRRPFVSVQNNQIKDYDQREIETNNPTEAEKDLRAKLQTADGSAKGSEISASVYKFNPNAIGIFVVYVFYFFWFFRSLLFGTIVYPEVLFWGALLVFVPLYIQNTNNPIFKAKIPDEGSLIFSANGMQVKDKLYPTENIEAAVVYLESFQGFTYRDRTSLGNANTKSAGDNNKISFRCNGEIVEFVFILADPVDYWGFKNLMTTWSSKGINVVMEKVFEDDFIIQEMVHFATPS